MFVATAAPKVDSTILVTNKLKKKIKFVNKIPDLTFSNYFSPDENHKTRIKRHVAFTIFLTRLLLFLGKFEQSLQLLIT